MSKYCAPTEHFYLYSALVIGNDWFERLPPEYQDILLRDALEAGDWATAQTRDSEEDINKTLAKKGVKFAEIDREEFKEASKSLYDVMGWAELKQKADAELAAFKAAKTTG